MKHIENMIASVWLRYWSNCWNPFGLFSKKTYHWIGKVTDLRKNESDQYFNGLLSFKEYLCFCSFWFFGSDFSLQQLIVRRKAIIGVIFSSELIGKIVLDNRTEICLYSLTVQQNLVNGQSHVKYGKKMTFQQIL